MYKFSVPADFQISSINKYETLSNLYSDSKIVEVYGQMTMNNTWGSGRVISDLPEIGIFELESYCEELRKHGISFNYTLNGTCFGNHEFNSGNIRDLKRFLKDIYSVGVTKLTIALPSLIEIVQDLPEKFEIKASTLCQITTLNKAVHYKNIGIRRMVIDESRNRSFGFLRQMTNIIGDGVELIVNVVCNKDCTYRMFHYNEMAHNTKLESGVMAAEYYSHRCMEQRLRTPENILKINWIRPEDLWYYYNIGIRHYKIQGRQAIAKGDLNRIIEAYFKKEYKGNLLLLLDAFAPTSSFMPYVENERLEGFIKPYINSEEFCMYNCELCNYCKNFTVKYLEHANINEICKKGIVYYLKSDKFRKAMQKKDCNDNIVGEYLSHEFFFE